MAHDKDVTIIGGGIAGLAAAIALEKTGHHVTLHERAQTFEPFGAGLQLGPNAVRALQKLGAWDAVSPIASAPPAIAIRSGVTGAILKTIHLGESFTRRFGQPYRVAHRADLHAALLSVARDKPSISIVMGSSPNATEVSARVIAADGIASATRQALFPGSAPRAEPFTIFRSLGPLQNLAGVTMENVNLWLYRGGHVVHYPVGVDKKLNVVAVTGGQSPRAHFAQSWGPLQNLLNNAPDFTPWPAAVVNALPAWHKGNVQLIGDAAHGTVPWLAQGGAMALEDAATLMDCPNPEMFERRRKARCERLIEKTLATGRMYHISAPASFARDLAIRLGGSNIILGRIAWIYNGITFE